MVLLQALVSSTWLYKNGLRERSPRWSCHVHLQYMIRSSTHVCKHVGPPLMLALASKGCYSVEVVLLDIPGTKKACTSFTAPSQGWKQLHRSFLALEHAFMSLKGPPSWSKRHYSPLWKMLHLWSLCKLVLVPGMSKNASKIFPSIEICLDKLQIIAKTVKTTLLDNLYI